MSSIRWSKEDSDTIIQSVGEDRVELGRIEHQNGKWILMLKDHSGAFTGRAGNYVRGDEWDSDAEAKRKAASCAVANLAHHAWLVWRRKMTVGGFAGSPGGPPWDQ